MTARLGSVEVPSDAGKGFGRGSGGLGATGIGDKV